MSNYSDSSYSDNVNSSWYKILHLVEEGSAVLDIGCSSGNFGAALIKEKACVVDGIELNSSDAKAARKKLRNVYVLNIETDSLAELSETYDYIYFGDVIEHLVDPVATLKRLEPLFKNKKKAKILFSLPNMSHISVRLMLLNGSFEYGKTGLLDNTHLHFYTLHELERVFNRAGMEISHFDPVTKDYPKSLLDEELSKVGLKNTHLFQKFVNNSNASIYQLVGYATYSKSPRPVKLNTVSPRDSFADHLSKTIEMYEKALADTNKHVGKLEKEIRRLNQEAQHMNEKYIEISQRLPHRIFEKLKRKK